MVEVVPLNPIHFHGIMPYDFEHAKSDCYFQKIQIGDLTKIQILSDEEALTLTVRDFVTDAEIASFPVAEIPTLLIDQDFRVFESTIDWSAAGVGKFYVTIEWGGGQLASSPFDVKSEQPNTLLFRYRNSENNYSVLFDTGIVFDLRVEGDIQDFEPRFDDEIYNDQLRNATKLSSVPYRVYTLYVGGSYGVPDWMADKVNRVMSCDMIKIDGDDFEKTPDADWEPLRQDNYPLIGLKIQIMPTNNLFLQRLKFMSDDDDMSTLVLKRLSRNFPNVSGSIQMQSTFRDMSVLIYLRVLRRGAPFTFTIGTSLGGAEIATFEAVEACGTYQVRHPFFEPVTLYIGGIGNDSDVSVIYEQLDETGGGSGGQIPPNPEIAGIGTVWMYHRSMADFEADFDMVTGLGRIGTPWQGWAFCNGDNGTPDMGGKVAVGYNSDIEDYNELGKLGGSNSVTLTQNQQGKFELQLMSGWSTGTSVVKQFRGLRMRPKGVAPWDFTALSENVAQGTWSQTYETGAGAASEGHENRQEFVVLGYVKKIA